MSRTPPSLSIEFCGEITKLDPGGRFVIGRDGDLNVDDNPYLHRRFLEVVSNEGLWWLSNTGTQLAASVTDEASRVQATLGPGAHLPVVFAVTIVRFTAGPTSYEMTLVLDEAPFMETDDDTPLDGSATLGRVTFTPDQRLLILSLAERALRRPQPGPLDLPSSAEATERLGWPITRFNRKLDNVCQKLEKAGVRGMHGQSDRLASNRRARLVEYALATRVVSADDLPLLDAEAASSS